MDQLVRLLKIMQTLRDPESGCAWDLEQTFESIVPYTIEEVYEVADAIDEKDYGQLKDELGDLLFQIVYYTQMAREQNLFEFEDVAENISNKLIRRHPHIFGNNKTKVLEERREGKWEKIKQQERADKSKKINNSMLVDIPSSQPQLVRAKKIQERVSSVGFDWPDITGVIEKVEEELEELKEVISKGNDADALEEELGDLLFSVVNLSRHIDMNAEDALRKGNNKFIKRFQHVEDIVNSQNKKVEDYSIEELEQFWQQAKIATQH